MEINKASTSLVYCLVLVFRPAADASAAVKIREPQFSATTKLYRSERAISQTAAPPKSPRRRRHKRLMIYFWRNLPPNLMDFLRDL